MHTILSLAVCQNWAVDQLDVKNAFLYGTLEETIHYAQPSGFIDSSKPDHVCLLNKSLYGLKQAPQAWYNRFASFVRSIGFLETKWDTSLFVLRRGSNMVYVDISYDY